MVAATPPQGEGAVDDAFVYAMTAAGRVFHIVVNNFKYSTGITGRRALCGRRMARLGHPSDHYDGVAFFCQRCKAREDKFANQTPEAGVIMNRSMEHQDRCGAAGLPLIVIDQQGREVPVPDGRDPSDFAEQLGPGHEALNRCIDHPDTPAVDCVICVPEED